MLRNFFKDRILNLGQRKPEMTGADPQEFKGSGQIFDFSSLLALGMTAWFCIASLLLAVGEFKFWTFAAVFVVGLVGSKPQLKNYYVDFTQGLKDFSRELKARTKWEKTLIGFIVLFVLLSLTSFVAPLESDGAAYYLPIAKLWADSGLFQMLRGYDDFSAVGAFAEIQMATIYLLGGEWLVRGFSALIPLLISIELFKFSKKLGLSFSAFLIQVLALYTSMCVMLIMYSGKIDLFSAWLGLLAIYCLFFDSKIYRAGLFLAAACIAKLSLLLPMFFVALSALVYRVRFSKESKNQWRSFFILGLKLAAPFLFVLVWQLVKNHVLFDNALAPFIGNKLAEEKYWFAPETISRIKMLYPLVWFFGDYWGQLGSFSILVLMFLPFAWLGKNRTHSTETGRVVPYWIGMFLIGMLMWFLVRPSFVAPRYIMGFFLIAFPLMGLGYDWFFQNQANHRLKAGITKAIIVIYSLHLVAVYLKAPLSPVRAFYSWRAPLSKCKFDGPDCVAMEILNEKAEPGSRVLQLMYESIWLRPDLIQTLRGSYELDGIETLSTDEKWKKIISRGFGFILLKASTHNAWVEKVGLREPPPWIEIQELFNFQGVAVWKIGIKNGPDTPQIPPEVELKLGRNGWDVLELK